MKQRGTQEEIMESLPFAAPFAFLYNLNDKKSNKKIVV